MKPLPAVGLASSIVQVVDFSIQLLQKENRIYQPTDGAIVENHAVLQDIANNLYRLILGIDQNDLKKLSEVKKGKLSEAAEQLLRISDETRELINPLIDAVLQAQAKGSYGDPKWPTARDALLTVWKKIDVTVLKKKLRNLRKEVEGALLITLRQYLDQSAETGLPVFNAEDPRTHQLEAWQNGAMDAVHTNDWKPRNKKDAEEFSKQVESLIKVENEAYFRHKIFTSLYSPVLNDRLHSIPKPIDGTFEWIFDERPKQGNSFVEWMSSKNGQNLFWITGKPGSGKSTLTKYLFRNERLFPSLESWSGDSPGILAGFFFWNNGTQLQKSPEGLLRSLLYESLQDMIYGPLEQDPHIIQLLFADRWNQFSSYGGGMQDLSFEQLRRAFQLMISDATKKFFFMIDGLDELDGYSNELGQLILATAKRDNVKICTSGRGLPIFQSAFENQPSLSLDLNTKGDIQIYFSDRFDQEDALAKIADEQSDDTQKHNIANSIVQKASGIFLWAFLATEFLLQQGVDDLTSLQSQADSLPSDLNELISHIFRAIEEADLKQASRLFRLIDDHGYPSLLELSYANDADPKSSIAAEIRPLDDSKIAQKVEDMRALLKNQCRSLLQIFEASIPGEPDHVDADTGNPERLKVNYTHRCIRDFLRTPEAQDTIQEVTGRHAFITDEHWANASLWALKTIQPGTVSTSIWPHIADAIEYALRLQDVDSKCRVTYLDEVGRAAITSPSQADALRTADLPPGKPVESLLDVAVWLNIQGYAAIKAKEVPRKEIRHAVEYNRELRKRLGTGGEEKWIGDRRKLKAAYVRNAPELDIWIEYYTRAVRFGPKPHFNVPEAV